MYIARLISQVQTNLRKLTTVKISTYTVEMATRYSLYSATSVAISC